MILEAGVYVGRPLLLVSMTGVTMLELSGVSHTEEGESLSFSFLSDAD
jgi:hypothetical protein